MRSNRLSIFQIMVASVMAHCNNAIDYEAPEISSDLPKSNEAQWKSERKKVDKRSYRANQRKGTRQK